VTSTQVSSLPSLEAVAAVADSCGRLMRGFNRVKAQLLAQARDDVEWSAYLIVSRLVIDGPVRLSALAEALQADPSSVSRQAAALVRDGLLERRADPADGRASLLVVTARGEALHSELRRLRNEHYRRLLADWTEDDCRVFAALTTRFTDGIGGIDQATRSAH
jgi:DNA-binding MarR family transcriptional regulator